MIDRFEHVQRPIVINDATYRLKYREILSPCRGNRNARVILFPRFLLERGQFTGLVTGFFFVIVVLPTVHRPAGEKEETSEDRNGEEHNARCRVCGER